MAETAQSKEPAFSQILYEKPAPKIARIVLNRPDRRNAQGVVMTYELDEAIRIACQDDEISVIILAAAGDHFNAGHDLGLDEAPNPTADDARSLWGQFETDGWEGYYSREHEMYLDITERWRNAPKPIIGEVQGAVVSGGLSLVWACDLIVCADNARFRDTTAADMAVPGVEFFQHSFEMTVRQAKEWLFTGDWMDADAALRRGMVNHVVPVAELRDFTLELAKKVAKTDRFALKLAKEAINSAQDTTGRQQAMKHAFSLHQIGHLHNLLAYGYLIDMSRLSPSLQEKVKERFKRHDGPSRPIGG